MSSLYYGTPERLLWEDEMALRDYIDRHLDKTIHRYAPYLIDEAVLTPVNLDCFNCHIVHGHNCCEGGQPYSMEGENLALFNKHALPILKKHTTSDRVLYAKQKGLFEKTANTNYYPSIRMYDRNCLFLIKEEGQHICAIHRYALENRMDPAKLKPFSCSLFPLEIIEYNDAILITALTAETECFSRWGDYYRSHYSCVNAKQRPENTSGHYFAEEGYIPAWEWGRELLISYWGEKVVREVEERLYAKKGGRL
ncbi:DUF3109 family protein [Aneurinibacillus terranovensis]|uniref:DUF3109 family protein n=1 Tax=Aneurinibacillus terranovensis TaxID=278991 RepID=UPI0003FB02EE|nr:DUF3109 family protein [Aneurinibacillus terranovensis]